MRTLFPVSVLLLLLMSNLVVCAQSNDADFLSKIRNQLPGAFENEDTCNALLSDVNGVKTNDPLLKGYIGGVYIARSRHAPLLDKRSALKTGIELLEQAIKEKPNNIELLFLRLSIQLNLPGFLGYDDDIEKDKAFVLRNYKQAPPVLKSRIINFIKTSGYFTDEEIDQITGS